MHCGKPALCARAPTSGALSSPVKQIEIVIPRSRVRVCIEHASALAITPTLITARIWAGLGGASKHYGIDRSFCIQNIETKCRNWNDGFLRASHEPLVNAL